MRQNLNVIGRYAPSPTGDLHLGNVRTALLAWLHCRVQGGTFLLRMEDLDLPRVVAGSAERILYDLEWLGLDWDTDVVYQSKRNDLYEAALSTLQSKGLVYPCFCSRKDIREAASAPHGTLTNEGLIYPGTCTNLSSAQIAKKSRDKMPALRIRVPDGLRDSCGDFVIKRVDKLFAYQLAVVVDDLEQGVTEIVRGADLLESTDRQLYLAGQLQPDTPKMNYFHVPLMMDTDGNRMSKRFGSLTLSQCRADGSSAQQIVGRLASSVGLIDRDQALSINELLAEVELSSLSGL